MGSFNRSRSLVLLPLIAVAASVGVGCVASTDAGSVSQVEPIETHATETVANTAQADLIGDIATAAIDLGALVVGFSTAQPEIGAMILAFAAEEKDEQELAADYSDDGTAESQARTEAMKKMVIDINNRMSALSQEITRTAQTLKHDVNTLADWDLHQNMAQIDSASRILANNGAPLGQGLTDEARRQLQTGVDLLEPQIADSLEYDIVNMPTSADDNVRRLAILTWCAAVRVRVAYGAAGIPLTRDWVLARQAFYGRISFPFIGAGAASNTPGGDGYVAFERWWYTVFHTFLDPYKAIRGVGDFDGDGYPDLVVHDAGTGKVKVWPVTSDFKVGLHGTLSSGGGYTIGTVDATQWQLKSVADYNADGMPDLLWETVDGLHSGVWTMNHLSVTSYANINLPEQPLGVGRVRPSLPADTIGTNPGFTAYDMVFGFRFFFSKLMTFDWYPRGAADFDNDGFIDVLWSQPSTGRVSAALTVPDSASAQVSLGPSATLTDTSWRAGPTWDIRGVGDFNRDGQTDILWQEASTKRLNVWLMNKLSVVNNPDLTFRPLHSSGIIHHF